MSSCGCVEYFYYFQRSYHFSHSELKTCGRANEPSHLPPLPKLSLIGSEDREFAKSLPDGMAGPILDAIAKRKKVAEERIADLKKQRRKLYQQDYQKNRRFPDIEARRAYNRNWRANNGDKRRSYEQKWRDTHVVERKASDPRLNKLQRLRQLRKLKMQLQAKIAANLELG